MEVKIESTRNRNGKNNFASIHGFGPFYEGSKRINILKYNILKQKLESYLTNNLDGA